MFRKNLKELNFDEKIEYIRRSSMGVPKVLTLPLDVAENNLILDITGNFFYMVKASNVTDTVQIRFNERREPQHEYTQQFGFYTPFYRLYLDWAAQPGSTVTFVYGTLSKEFLDILDNRSAALQAAILENILGELQGIAGVGDFSFVAVPAAAAEVIAANANRRSVFIQHDRAGAGLVYLGYDNTVAANKHFISLAPRDFYTTDNYRGTIFAIRSAGATNIGVSEV